MLKYRKEFHDMFTEFSQHSEFGPLMTRMQVVDAQGDSKMDEEQWEAASESSLVYRTCLADVALRHLHWVHLRKTIVISLSAFVFCSFRFAFVPAVFCILFCISLLPFALPDTSPLLRLVMTFSTHVYVGHFQVVWIL